jgi:hypothetical protein
MYLDYCHHKHIMGHRDRRDDRVDRDDHRRDDRRRDDRDVPRSREREQDPPRRGGEPESRGRAEAGPSQYVSVPQEYSYAR